MNPIVKGSIKSKTNWLGLALLIFGTLQANHEAFGAVLDPKYLGLINMAFGIAVIVLRYFTSESLAEKGA
jgi:hypothetical protein